MKVEMNISQERQNANDTMVDVEDLIMGYYVLQANKGLAEDEIENNKDNPEELERNKNILNGIIAVMSVIEPIVNKLTNSAEAEE